MNNPYTTYYVNQAGSGISGFRGLRRQKGYGWLPEFFANVFKPFIRQAASAVSEHGSKIAKNALTRENIESIAKVGGPLLVEALSKRQTGSGRRRKRTIKRRPKKSRSSVRKRPLKRKQRKACRCPKKKPRRNTRKRNDFLP